MAEADMKMEVDVKGMEPKSGPKTSEFWVTVITQILGVILAAIGAYKGSDGLAAVGGILTGAAQGTYTLGRSKAKQRSA